MDINGPLNTAASTDAMKKAMAMPNLMLNLLQLPANASTQSLDTKLPEVQQSSDLAAITGKGNVIDIIA